MNQQCKRCDYLPERPKENEVCENSYNMCIDCKFLYESGTRKPSIPKTKLKNNYFPAQHLSCYQCNKKILLRTAVQYNEVRVYICNDCKQANKGNQPTLPLILLEMQTLLSNSAYAKRTFSAHEKSLYLLLKKYIDKIAPRCNNKIEDKYRFVKMFRQVDITDEPDMDSIIWNLLNSSEALWLARKNIIDEATIFQQKR